MFNDNGSFLLALFEFFLFFAWFMCLFWVFGDIFRSTDLGGGAKTIWVIFVILVPWLGILVYLLARGGGMQQRQLEQAKAMQAAQAEYIQSVATSSPASATDQIAHANATQADAKPYDEDQDGLRDKRASIEHDSRRRPVDRSKLGRTQKRIAED